MSTEERKTFLKRHHIALFDVIRECDIKGSLDSTIRNPIVNDFSSILSHSRIVKVFTTGSLANQLYRKYVSSDNIALPSPSAANAQMDFSSLVEAYSIILSFLGEMS